MFKIEVRTCIALVLVTELSPELVSELVPDLHPKF